MDFKYFIANKLERIKIPELEGNSFHSIDVNSWFKSNNLNPSEMNEIRQFIFEEWMIKKLQSTKNKISTGSFIIILYDHPTDVFIKFLEKKISEIFECETCEVISLK